MNEQEELIEALRPFAYAADKADEFCENSKRLGMGSPSGNASSGFGVKFHHLRHARDLVNKYDENNSDTKGLQD